MVSSLHSRGKLPTISMKQNHYVDTLEIKNGGPHENLSNHATLSMYYYYYTLEIMKACQELGGGGNAAGSTDTGDSHRMAFEARREA